MPHVSFLKAQGLSLDNRYRNDFGNNDDDNLDDDNIDDDDEEEEDENSKSSWVAG